MLIFPAVLIALACGGLLIQKAAKTNEALKGQLLARVRPFLDRNTDIRKLDFSLSRLHLRGVLLAPKDRSFLLEIEDLQIGYSLWNVIRFGFNPNKVAHEVVLYHPILTLKKRPTAPDDSIRKSPIDSVKKAIEAFASIQRFAVSKAELRVENTLGQDVPVARELDGDFWTHPMDSADIRLTGCLFDSKKPNLQISGKLNLNAVSVVRLNIQIDESELSREIPQLAPGFLSIRGGRIRAYAHLDPVRGTKGFLELQNGFFSLKKAPLRFDDVNLIGSIADSTITLHGSIQRFNGSRVDVSGIIRNWLDPHFDVSVSCPQLDLNAFFSHMSPNIRSAASGKACFSVRLNGSPDNPELNGRFSSDEFMLYGMALRGLDSRIHLKDSVMILEGNNGSGNGLGVIFRGRMDLTDEKKTTSLTAEWKGDFLKGAPSWLQKRSKKLEGNLDCRFDGEFEKLAGNIQGHLSVASMTGQSVALKPRLTYQNSRFGIVFSSDRAFQMDGEVLYPFRKNIHWNLTCQGAEWLLQFFPELRIIRPDSGFNAQCVFKGTAKEWFLEADGNQPTRKHGQVFQAKLVSKSGSKIRQDFQFNANVFGPEGNLLPIEARLSLSPNAMVVQQCEIGNWFYAHGQIPRLNHGALKAELRMDNLDLEKLHSLFPRLKQYSLKANGRLLFTGTRDKPFSRLDFSFSKGRLHEIDGFEGEISCEWIGKVFQTGVLNIRKNDLPLLVGHFSPAQGDSVTGNIQSGNLRFDELTQAWSGKRNFLNGEGSFEFGIRGPGLAPVMFGQIRIRNGSFKTVSFSEFSADISDTLQDQTGLSGGICSVQNGKLVRDDGLEIDFRGSIPHGRKKTGDFSVQAKGNLLGVLTEVDDFFKNAKGTGEAVVRFAIQNGIWLPLSGAVQLQKGQLEFSSVIRKIEKLQGEARLTEGSPFLQIIHLAGQVDGGQFSLTNSPIPGVESLVFQKLGIHLGVLSLSTQGKGIPLHFPGLMEPGEQGWIGFSGLKKGDPFFITGPVSSPGLVGTLALNDDRITYPFLHTGESGPRFSFLNRVRWNLRVVPRKDVHYIRSIASAFGNVYLDLQLQDGNGDLKFEGMIQDDTFDVWGNLVSTDGTIEVMDRYFKPERITFDYPKGAHPILSGRAYMTLTDSTGVPSTVWMNLISSDRVTGAEEKGGTLDKLQFKFSTDNPNLGRTEADLLAALGYSVQNFRDRAYDAVGMQMDNYFFRPIFRPLERGMRRYFGLDMVRFSSMFGRNLIQLRDTQPMDFDPRWLLRSTKLTVGKYLSPGLILTYSGEIQNEYGYWTHTDGIWLRHSLSLEYSIRPDLFLEMEYLYDNRLLMQRREDARVWLKHVFPF